jgi:hypothetical protein
MSDGICRSCRWSFAQGAVVAIAPPRAEQRGMAAWLERWRRPRIIRPARAINLPWWGSCLLALIPGLGHVAAGRWRFGFGVAVAVAVLVLSAFIIRGGVVGPLLGLAASVHGFSVFDLTPWRRGDGFARLAALSLIVVAFFLFAYRPIVVDIVLDDAQTAPGGRGFGGHYYIDTRNEVAMFLAVGLPLAGAAALLYLARKPKR